MRVAFYFILASGYRYHYLLHHALHARGVGGQDVNGRNLVGCKSAVILRGRFCAVKFQAVWSAPVALCFDFLWLHIYQECFNTRLGCVVCCVCVVLTV